MSVNEPLICRNCQGAGKVQEPCADCAGKGWLLPVGFIKTEKDER